jgi:hypothetical protein
MPSTPLGFTGVDDSSTAHPNRHSPRAAGSGPEHRVSRRAFLKTSIAGAALAIVTPPLAPTARTQPVIPPKPRRVAGPKRTYALEQIRKMRGGSQPHLMRCSDGGYYVVKFQNNPQHRRVLVNEMLGTGLAAALGLPTAPTCPIYVAERLIELTPQLSMEMPRSWIPCQSGMQFGSRYPGDPRRPNVCDSIPQWELHKVTNLWDFAGMFVFDKWVCNTDGRQVLFIRETDTSPFSRVSYTAVMIDQGMCFDCGDWKFPDAPLRSIYYHKEVYKGVRGIGDFEPWLSRLESEINLQVLTQAANEIPPEWYESDRPALDELLERLDRRRRTIRETVSAVCSASPRVFPNWRRSVREAVG